MGEAEESGGRGRRLILARSGQEGGPGRARDRHDDGDKGAWRQCEVGDDGIFAKTPLAVSFFFKTSPWPLFLF